MKRVHSLIALATGITVATLAAAQADPRLREVVFDQRAIVTVPVKRGVVTHIVLASDEAIAEVGSGLGGDCANADAVWCIATQPGGRNLFVKPKSGARAPNNLAVVTDRRTHAFRFVVLDDGDTRAPVYRLEVKARVEAAQALLVAPSTIPLPDLPDPLPPEEVVAERMQTEPRIVNSAYSIAEGSESNDIVPTLVFDDGRFTYFRLPGNREVPAVFHVLGDGSEALVNTRMEGDLMVVDRVSRRLMLRAGSAVVGVWNDAFDLEGSPPKDGTAVPGVQRVLKVGKAGVDKGGVVKAEKPERAVLAKDGEGHDRER